MFTNNFRIKALYGEFAGILTFYEDCFQIDNQLYSDFLFQKLVVENKIQLFQIEIDFLHIYSKHFVNVYFYENYFLI